jgi:hypothetical protein
MTVNNELEGMWKEAGVLQFVVIACNLTVESSYIKYPSPGFPEYKEAPTTHSLFSSQR